MLQSVSLLYYTLCDKNKLPYLIKGVIILANIFLDMLQRKGSREISLLSLIWGVLTFSDKKTINDEVFQETTEYEKGFAKYYQENLKPKISELEEERLNALRTAAQKIRPLIIVFISILISFLFVWFILGDLLDVFYIEDFLPFYYEITELSDGNSIFYFAIVFLIYVSLLYFFTLPTLRSVRNLKSSSKSEIFSVILKFFGDFTFTAKPNISVSQFESTGLIPKYKREENEDYVIGDYEGVKVELFESILSLTEKNTDLLKTKEDNKFVTTITFQGLFVKFQMNKNFNGKTVVSDGTAKTKGLKEVILEDPEFKNIWAVHSDDQVEARYLLTVTFMERLKELNTFISQFNDFGSRENIFSGTKRKLFSKRMRSKAFSTRLLRNETTDRIQCCFQNDTIFLMIPSDKDFFQSNSIFEPLNFIDDSRKVLNEIGMIFKMVDILKLNQKTNL